MLGRVRQLPQRGLPEVLAGAPALVVAPHPDDESLGCGGLIAEAVATGCPVHVLVVTDGAGSHPGVFPPDELRRLRQRETVAAVAVLGLRAEHVTFWTVPDGHAPRHGRAARRLASSLAGLVRELGARTILTAWDFDSHPDHVAAYTYARLAAGRGGVAVFAYPVWAWTLRPRLAVPNRPLAGFNLPVWAHLDAKRAAVMCHGSQTGAATPAGAGFALTDGQLAAMIKGNEPFIAANAEALRRLQPKV